MRKRLLISVACGVTSGLFCWILHVRLHQGAGDFTFPIRLAQNLLAGTNLYDSYLQQYPLTAGVFALPFVRLQPEAAAGLFIALSTTLLAFGLTRDGYTRLFVFLAYPYWLALLLVQWSPLLMAAAFFPLLLPVTLAKPQIGLPVAITHLTWRGIVACLVLVAVTLILRPSWPALWFRQLGYYQNFIPLAVFPGPLLLLALFRREDRDSYLLLTSALMPQRWFYDAFILWLIPKNRREILATSVLSWGTGITRWFYPPHSFEQVGQWTVLWIYLPMLFLLLLRPVTRAPAPPMETMISAAKS